MMKTYTLGEVKTIIADAFESGYFEGAGDEAWYASHTDVESTALDADSYCAQLIQKEIAGFLVIQKEKGLL